MNFTCTGRLLEECLLLIKASVTLLTNINHFPWYQYNFIHRDQFIHLYKRLCFIYILKAVLRCPSRDAQPFNYQQSRSMCDVKSQRTKHKSWVPSWPQAVQGLGDSSALLWNSVSPKPVWYGSTRSIQHRHEFVSATWCQSWASFTLFIEQNEYEY